jgi:hypothetical protein
MTRTILSLILATAAAGFAAPAAGATTTDQDRQSASQECRFERGATAATHEAFAAKYGTNHNHKNAFGKCVAAKTRDESAERTEAAAKAPAACRAEQGDTDASKAAFAAKYGTNHNGKNAFGKCVSAKAREMKATADAQDRQAATARKNAAKQCADERGTSAQTRAAFAGKYASFGKCVSQRARAEVGS